MRWFFCVMASVLTFGGGVASSEAQADLMLSLTSSVNLDALPVHQPVTFDVWLSGLETGQELSALAATIAYTNLGSSSISWGGIVPGTGDLDSNGDGQADASFFAGGSQSADRICGGGIFFSFEAVVQNLGEGELRFSYASASQFDPPRDFSSNDEDNPVVCDPVIGSVLKFTAVEVPEPSTWVLLVTVALAAVSFCFKRRM